MGSHKTVSSVSQCSARNRGSIMTSCVDISYKIGNGMKIPIVLSKDECKIDPPSDLSGIKFFESVNNNTRPNGKRMITKSNLC
jgi:hypothetical protein